MFENKTIERIENMLDSAMNGEFQESYYDETKLSRLESKWKKYLTTSQMSKKQLDETKKNLEGLISDISHQTKTPMSNLKLYSELLSERLENRDDTTDDDRKLISEIKSQTDKLDFLIMSLTKMSRLESNIIEVKPKTADVVSFVKTVVDSMRVQAKIKNITLRIESSDVKCDACFDSKWTREALSNIIDNAIKYSLNDSTVTISIIPYEIYVAISVKDEGIGVSEEEYTRIFERFYRSEKVSDKEGVGLGLYLTREILQRENGYIKVKSDTGKGSEFIMYLWRG